MAQQQIAAEAAQVNQITPGATSTVPLVCTTTGSTAPGGIDGNTPQPDKPGRIEVIAAPVLRRFYGNVEIDAMRINRDASAIANEVIQHLTALKGATVKITLEIQADIPDGVPDDVARTVMENCRTLKFNAQAFEQS